MTAGLTQSELAHLAGISQGEVSKTENGSTRVGLEARCRLVAATGHELGWRLYPVATVRLRDSGQLTLAQAIIKAAHPSWHARLEVPMGPDDRRAADLVLNGPNEVLHIEIERALVDLQAQVRAAQLKREALAERSSEPMRLILAVPDTRRARAVLAQYEELLARALPVRSKAVWQAIRRGDAVGGDGVLFVRGQRH